MKTKTFSAIGGWNSFLFCIGMYVVALFFSIFVCSSVFYAIKSRPATGKVVDVEKVSTNNKQVLASVTH